MLSEVCSWWQGGSTGLAIPSSGRRSLQQGRQPLPQIPEHLIRLLKLGQQPHRLLPIEASRLRGGSMVRLRRRLSISKLSIGRTYVRFTGKASDSRVDARALEVQRIGTHPGDHRFRQSISLAVMRKTTARANWANR